MAEVDWAQLLIDATAPPAVRAHTYLQKWASASQPVLVRCDDGRDYVAKGSNAGRMPVNDQIVARVGHASGAPVGEPALVDIPAELVAGEPEMAHVAAGLAHGTSFIAGCSERSNYDHTDVTENRPRFAALAILYGLIVANDHQFIYENAAPHLVHSVDHGHFFPNGPDWTTASLQGCGVPTPDPAVVSSCALTDAELDQARAGLAGCDNQQVAAAVVAAPNAWGVTTEERIALCTYISTRRDALLAPLEAQEGD